MSCMKNILAIPGAHLAMHIGTALVLLCTVQVEDSLPSFLWRVLLAYATVVRELVGA